MPLIITAKDRVANNFQAPAGDDLRTAFLQVERHAQLLETAVGVNISSNATVGDVSIGGLVGNAAVPASSTAIVNGTTVLGVARFRMFANHRYICYVYGSGQVTVAVPTFVNITTTAAPLAQPTGPLWFVVSQNSPPVTAQLSGTQVMMFSPSTTTAETITVSGQSSGASATWTIPAAGVQIYMVRVA